jgi:hypothetical protein
MTFWAVETSSALWSKVSGGSDGRLEQPAMKAVTATSAR